MKYYVIIVTVLTALLFGCGEGYIVSPPPPVVITDSLIMTIDSLWVTGQPNYTESISQAYNFFGVDSVVMTFNIITTSDSNMARIAFSELNNFDNKHIPFICGGNLGQCGTQLITFKFNPVWDNFSVWFWFNVNANTTLKFRNIRIYKANTGG